MGYGESIQDVWIRGRDSNALEFEGKWFPWRGFLCAERQLALIFKRAGIDRTAAIGLIARNRPGAVVALAALLAQYRCVVMIYAAQTPAGIAADILRLKLAAVIGDASDWTEEVKSGAREAGSLGISVGSDPENPVSFVDGLSNLGSGPFRKSGESVTMELLTSGTTGAPKRVPISVKTFESAVADATAIYAAGQGQLQTGIVFHPLSNIAGVTFLIPMMFRAQPICLLEKFTLPSWLDAVKRHRPTRGSLPPAVLRTILDEKVSREALASFSAIGVGAATLDPTLQERFEAEYGIPLLISYGATEFCGVIANWTLEVYQKMGYLKRGSVGLARPGVALRVVNPVDGAELPHGAVGVLEAEVARIGNGWIRTTDLASIDDDGFLYLHGRADGAINRGGFKVLPETVATALRQHPDVVDAAAVGIIDRRLGEVPVAAVQLRAGSVADEAALMAFARERLLTYQVPVAVKALAELPRNASMKVDLAALKQLLEVRPES
jgi:long-chain acyl-CoA synthetase